MREFLIRIIKILKYFYFILLTLPRDIRAAIILSKIKRKSKEYDNKDYSLQDIFGRLVRNQPNKPCIVFDDQVWTYKKIEDYSNKIANTFSDKFHLKKGDCVALFMENRPEFVCIWYGLGKLGVITALINTNLKLKTLVHSIQVADPKIVIYDEELEQAILDVKDDLKIELIRHGLKKTSSNKNIPQFESLVEDSSDLFTPKEKIVGRDVLMYIYTSGTTGLPKPAIIKHNRYVAGGFSFFDASRLTPNDVFLVTLPIYHSNAGVMGLGAALVCGATVVLRKKFSASNFWKDAIKYECTAFSYVGEICRYLLNQPLSDLDRKHKIKVCIGNGTRENISRDFLTRFGVKCIEIYGATEGNCVLVNTVGRHGACGFIPLINNIFTLLPIYIIKIDDDMNPIRNERGFCIKCEPGEKGLLVGQIDKSTKSDYSGYANNTDASNKKIILNLFKPNQKAFNTGDVVKQDWYGFVYFVDRLGDTFRWRGENVSTIQVEDAISNRLNSIECICYGVEVSGQEGKAGMVTICSLKVDLKQLGEHITNDLPFYARPLFIRLAESVEHTGSFKAQKATLIKQAYNVNIFKDKTYYLDTKNCEYKELTKDIYDKIQKGLFKL